MKRKVEKKFYMAAAFFALFAVWTVAVRTVDVAPIGPLETAVGFAKMNAFVRSCTGEHMTLYVLTDWLSLVPVGLMVCFGLLGLWQWIGRKSLWKVDRSILLLGVFYVAVLAAYVFFEIFAVNYRPVLIDGRLEASYPSSTTLLVLCVMPTAELQLKKRIKREKLQRGVTAVLHMFALFMVAARLVSGVHWFSDIVGGSLLSAALVTLYDAFCGGEGM